MHIVRLSAAPPIYTRSLPILCKINVQFWYIRNSMAIYYSVAASSCAKEELLNFVHIYILLLS